MNCIQQHHTPYSTNLNKNVNFVCFNTSETALQQAVSKILAITSIGFHLHILFIVYFSHSYRATWYYQRLLFTNECASDCLKINIKIYIK